MRYFADRQQCKEKPLLRFHGKPQQVCIVNNNIQAYLAQKCEGKT
jgi:hypothetical protein